MYQLDDTKGFISILSVHSRSYLYLYLGFQFGRTTKYQGDRQGRCGERDRHVNITLGRHEAVGEDGFVWTACLDNQSVVGKGENSLVGKNEKNNNHVEGYCEH